MPRRWGAACRAALPLPEIRPLLEDEWSHVALLSKLGMVAGHRSDRRGDADPRYQGIAHPGNSDKLTNPAVINWAKVPCSLGPWQDLNAGGGNNGQAGQ
jgi:hypothetical protein